ncbi:TPA: asparagine synthase-related protein [Clostridium perfringens]
MIILENNNGFKWEKDFGYNFKGYFYYKNNIYKGKEAIELLKKINNFKEFEKFVAEINGIFAIIINKQKIWIAVDNSRSFPIFYSNDYKYISDSIDYIKEYINVSLDEVSLAEMLLGHNCSSGKTVYNEIKQVQLGEVIELFGNNINSKFYFKHIHLNIEREKSKLLNEFSLVLERVFDRLIESLDGKCALVPLSGGYDSRLIVSMLKKKNYKNVICYTYGNKNDYEVNYSRRIAKELGYKWYFIEYSKEKWKDFLKDEKTFKYLNYCSNDSSLPHIQDFIAISTLKNNNMIPENSIVIPGFCGDLPAGSFIINENDLQTMSKEDLCEYIFNKHFINFKTNREIKNIIKERISLYLNKMQQDEIKDFEEYISLYEGWFTSDRPSLWVVNSNRVNEFFDLEWRIPLWDSEFLKFWYSLSTKYRKNCNLYIEWIFNNLFIPLKIDILKPKKYIIKDKNDNNLKLFCKSIIKKILIFISMNLGIDLYKRNNINNYNVLAIYIYKLIKNKDIFNYDFQSVHQIESLWWCEYKYGSDNVRKIIKKGELYDK